MGRREEFKLFMDGRLGDGNSMDIVMCRLEELDYFEVPASINHHGKYSGGLYDHSYEVAVQLLDLTERLDLKWDRPESPYIIGMFHDICKCQTYKRVPSKEFDDNNMIKIQVKTPHDEWIYDKFNLLPGHGDTSVILTQQIIGPLTKEETLCIRWHMGAFDDKENWNLYSNAVQLCPNVLYTHTADMIASQICNT